MKISLVLLMLTLLPLGAQAPAGRMTITVNKADLKDILRAATQDTPYSLLFQPGLDTQVQGLHLKAKSLDDLLDQVLPSLGFTCVRQGSNLYIQKTSPGIRFYHVEQLAMARAGSKSFQVNASGQLIQAAGGTAGATGANTSAYASSVQMGQVNDLWADLENGLQLLVFGKTMDRQSSTVQAVAPGSRGFADGGKSLLIQPNPGLVVVDADLATHLRVEAYLKEIRQRTQRQVLLEARIVEVALTNDSQVGVDWNGLLSNGAINPAASSFTTGGLQNLAGGATQGLLRLVAQSGRVQATLSALARDNKLKVLSTPRLSALNNQKAILRVVREEAYGLASSQITPGTAGGGAIATGQITPLIVPVGIILDIQPQIGDDGVITLAVNPSISEVTGVRTFIVPNSGRGGLDQATTELPVVDRRDLDTVVRIRSGETLVLAGIIRTREEDGSQGVPWLSKIPFLGSLFAKKQKIRTRTELAIFISPTLMEDPAQVQVETLNAAASPRPGA